MKLACSTVNVCFNYSPSFSNKEFSSYWNSTKEVRLLRNDMLLKFKTIKDDTINHPGLNNSNNNNNNNNNNNKLKFI